MESELYTNWLIGLAIVSVIVVAAAALLILIILAARRILRLAKVALELVIQIKGNTQSIWCLEDTNEVAVGILAGAEQIKTHAGQVAQALHEAE